MIDVHGEVTRGFEPVRDAFVRNFDFGEVGAAVAVEVGGRRVVDLWGGHRSSAGDPWEADTIVCTFSVTKGVTAICCNRLIDRRLLDPDAPVARYWPEFGAAGKERITVRQALSHQAGLAAVDGDLTFDDIFDWDRVVAAIAAQEPNWEPGTAHGYHARTFGWIAGELIRRVTGISMGRYLRDEIAEPYGVDFWVGLPESLDRRCADLIGDPAVAGVVIEHPSTLAERVAVGPGTAFQRVYDDETWNRRDIRATELPSSNGHGSARALARLYAAVLTDAHGPRLLSDSGLIEATTVQASGPDAVLGMPMTFGIGFMVGHDFAPAASPIAFGHAGAGGSLAFGDPGYQVSFGYVINQMKLDGASDRRSYMLVRALYQCLAAR